MTLNDAFGDRPQRRQCGFQREHQASSYDLSVRQLTVLLRVQLYDGLADLIARFK